MRAGGTARGSCGSCDRGSVGGAARSVGMRFVIVPAGAFAMGSARTESGRLENEGPQRTVRITRPFSLGVTEVTIGQMEAFAAATGYVTDAERDAEGGFGIDFATGKVVRQRGITFRAPGFPGFEPGPQHPAVLVSWQDAEAFCAWLSRVEKRRYRLPTEAEWEYAARAGRSGRYATGDDPASLRGSANVADASLRAAVPALTAGEAWDDGFPFLAPVASFAANAFGLYDVHGNVWEWCADWYAPDAYAHAAADDPQGPAEGSFRTIRGGGWFNPAVQNRSAQRIYFDPTFRYCLLSGFRVACDAE